MFLARALHDIQSQEFRDWNLIVVNDGGDPHSVDALIEGRNVPNCSVIHLHAKVGRPAAGNRGFAAGAAPFVALHDDDDTWHPAFLSRTVSHLQQTNDLAVAVRTRIVYERETPEGLVEVGGEIFHPNMLEPLYFDHLRFNHMVPISMLLRRSALDEVGGFDESLLAVEDWWLNLLLLASGGMGFLDEVLAYWHHRPDSRGDTGNSVFDGIDEHFFHDRAARDGELRKSAQRHGMGFDMAVSAMVDATEDSIESRLRALEEDQAEVLRLLAGHLRAR
jgi:glycosyltransferase involved in cell wall biosynthesis